MTTVSDAPKGPGHAGVFPTNGSNYFDYSKLTVAEPVTKTFKNGDKEGEYKSSQVKHNGVNVTLKIPNARIPKGVQAGKFGGHSFGIALDPAIPEEKEIIRELKQLHLRLGPLVMKVRKSLTPNSYIDTTFLHFQKDQETNMPLTEGPCMLYVQIEENRFPTRIFIGNERMSATHAGRLVNTSLVADVEWVINYIYFAAQNKFMTGCREIAVTSLEKRKQHQTFADTISKITEEKTNNMLKQLQEMEEDPFAALSSAAKRPAEESTPPSQAKRHEHDDPYHEVTLEDLIARGGL